MGASPVRQTRSLTAQEERPVRGAHLEQAVLRITIGKASPAIKVSGFIPAVALRGWIGDLVDGLMSK